MERKKGEQESGEIQKEAGITCDEARRRDDTYISWLGKADTGAGC